MARAKINTASTLILPVPEWSKTRALYKKLSDEFHVITKPFGIELSADRSLMLDHLILTIDELDGYLDEIPDKKDRDLLTASIISFLDGEGAEWNFDSVEESLRERIIRLKSIILHCGVKDRFIIAASDIFRYTEEKRHTETYRDLKHLIIQEGISTSELPMSLMGVDAKSDFGRFFKSLCSLMGIADLVMDFRADYGAKYIRVKPNVLFYVNLIFMLSLSGFKLIFNFPKPIQFTAYCFRFGWLLLTTKD